MLHQESSASIPLAEPHCYSSLVSTAGIYVQSDLAGGVGSLMQGGEDQHCGIRAGDY
jgi:hypothetical protein